MFQAIQLCSTPQRVQHRLPQLQHIMIITDHAELAESLQMELNRKGFQVSVISDGIRGLLAIQRVATDLVVVDWSPPRISGIEICQRLRASQRNASKSGTNRSIGEAPIILLTQNDDVGERIAGLEAGANDCLALRCDREELLARIHANLARNQPLRAESAVLRCADIQLNRRTREVFRGDRFIRLTAKEFDLLEYLMRHYFQVLTRSQILENVWGYEYMGSSNVIEVYIRYLRRKLESEKEIRLIHTVRSVGYIFREEGAFN
ncbi:MAG: response regulator transcription factor [Cyanobacteria bacterium P01_D01_bin.1]